MKYLKFLISIVDKLNDWIGKIVSMLIFPMIFVLIWEVVMRYLFNKPTIWAHELSAMLYAVFFLLGGPYALRWNAHIKMDIVYNLLSLRGRAIIDLFTWLFFYFFCGVLLWQSLDFAWVAAVNMEHSTSLWRPPIWPIKLCIPLAAFLILLQGLMKTICDVFTVFKGREFPSKVLEIRTENSEH